MSVKGCAGRWGFAGFLRASAGHTCRLRGVMEGLACRFEGCASTWVCLFFWGGYGHLSGGGGGGTYLVC